MPQVAAATDRMAEIGDCLLSPIESTNRLLTARRDVNILIASSEAVPFSKTGGLADVSGALPVELARRGHQVALFTPMYRNSAECGLPIETTDIRLDIPIGNRIVTGTLLRSHLPESQVPVYLVQQDQYFDREETLSRVGRRL